MPGSEPDPIVVGVHSGSTAAVTWAARQAALEDRPLRLVHARTAEFAWLLAGGPAITRSTMRADDTTSASPVLDHALDIIDMMRPDQRVSALAAIASPARLLIQEAGPGSTIVVGNHGTSTSRQLLTGTIWQAILPRSSRPVVAVTGRPVWPDASVVVGVDTRGTAHAAIEFGYAQAARCGVTLRLCHVLRRWPHNRAAVLAGVIARNRLLEYAQRYPQVTSTLYYLTGDPVRQLIDAAADAQLLVIGNRGHGAVGGALTRSVSHALLRAAPCPIAVIPHDRRPAR